MITILLAALALGWAIGGAIYSIYLWRHRNG